MSQGLFIRHICNNPQP